MRTVGLSQPLDLPPMLALDLTRSVVVADPLGFSTAVDDVLLSRGLAHAIDRRQVEVLLEQDLVLVLAPPVVVAVEGVEVAALVDLVGAAASLHGAVVVGGAAAAHAD